MAVDVDAGQDFMGSVHVDVVETGGAVIGRQIPLRTIARPLPAREFAQALRTACSEGIGLSVAPAEELDLRELEVDISGLLVLHLREAGSLISGWRLLEAANNLEYLWVVGARPKEAVDLRHLPKLARASLDHKAFRSLAFSASLNALETTLDALGASTTVTAPVRTLSLSATGREVDFSLLGTAQTLEHLDLAGARLVDLGAIGRFTNLRTLVLRANVLRNAQGLRELRHLRRVWLVRVREVVGWSDFDELPISDFRVEPNYILGEDFRARVEDRTGWYVPPRRS